jgi:PilZ domain
VSTTYSDRNPRTAPDRGAGVDDVHECDTVLTTGAAAGPDPDVRRVFRCSACHWEVECLAAEADRMTAAGCPRCEGGLAQVPQPPVAHDEFPPEEALRTRNKRLLRRRPPRSGVKAEVRRGGTGLGPDLGLGLIDLSEDGLGLRLRAAARPGEEVEVVLLRSWNGKPLKVRAEVRWCRPDPDGSFLSGVRLRRRLCRREFQDLVV